MAQSAVAGTCGQKGVRLVRRNQVNKVGNSAGGSSTVWIFTAKQRDGSMCDINMGK